MHGIGAPGLDGEDEGQAAEAHARSGCGAQELPVGRRKRIHVDGDRQHITGEGRLVAIEVLFDEAAQRPQPGGSPRERQSELRPGAPQDGGVMGLAGHLVFDREDLVVCDRSPRLDLQESSPGPHQIIEARHHTISSSPDPRRVQYPARPAPEARWRRPRPAAAFPMVAVPPVG